MEAIFAVAATYYLVTVLTRIDGPWGILYRLRKVDWLPFHCSICTAPWAAIGAMLTVTQLPPEFITILALAGAVVALNDLREALIVIK